MRKIYLVLIPAFLLITLTSVGAHAQGAEKKEAPKTSTIDAWREALPDNDQSSTVPIVGGVKDNVEEEETTAQTEKRILDLENRFIEAIKLRDAASLKSFLAEDFTVAGVNLSAESAGASGGVRSQKKRFIDWTLKNLEIKSYNVEKTTVRVYSPVTAVVTTSYKRQALIGGIAADGDFVVTNVWIKLGKRWQAVSHHISSLAKP